MPLQRRSRSALNAPFEAIATKPLRWLIRRVRSRFETGIYYVVGDAQWSEYWDGRYLTSALRQNTHVPAHLVADARGLRNQLLHFGNRYSYLHRAFHSIHPSNAVVLTWFHGFPPGLRPSGEDLEAALLEAEESIDRILVTCELSKEGLSRLGIPEAKVVQVPLGVDLLRFAPPEARRRKLEVRQQLGVPPNAICVGSFQKDGVGWGEGSAPKLIKGPDVFLQVVERLAEDHGDIFVLLTGPARGYVKRGLERLGVPYVHRLLDNYEELPAHYHALDLYLITSRSEGGPKALLECWATAVPVVSTRVGMAADLVRHGKNGMLADVEDTDALARHATMVLSDPALADRCVRAALADVQHYSWESIADRYLKDLYRPLLPGRNDFAPHA